MADKPLTKGNTVSFGYDIAYHRTKVSYIGNINWNSQSDSTGFSNSLPFAPQKRSLIYNTVSIPLEIRFRKESWKHLKLHLGGTVGYGFGLHQKTRFEQSNGHTTSRRYTSDDFNALQYGVHVRVGIRNWSLFGAYNLNPLFASSKSVKLNVLKLGLSISLF